MKNFKVVTALAVAAGISVSSSAHATFWDIYPPQLYHQIGGPLAGWWRAVVDSSNSGRHTTYGPYATVPSGDAIAMTTMQASPGTFSPPTPGWLSWTVEVYDSASKTSLASKSYATSSGGHYVTILPFGGSPLQNIEVRTQTWGNGTFDQCGVHIMNEAENKIQDINPATDQLHQVGDFPNVPTSATMWEAACPPDGTCPGAYLSYGPYWNLYNDHTGTVIVLFSLAASGMGTDPAANVNVTAYDSTTRTRRILAAKDLYASDIGGAFGGKIPIKIDVLPQYTSYEYRVYWFGKGYIAQERTKVFDPKLSICTW